MKTSDNQYIIEWKNKHLIHYYFYLNILLSLYAKFVKKIKLYFAQNTIEEACNIVAIQIIVIDDPLMIGWLHCTMIGKYILLNS